MFNLDWMKKYRWYRRARGGMWIKLSVDPGALGIPLAVYERWYNYGPERVNHRFEKILEIEDHRTAAGPQGSARIAEGKIRLAEANKVAVNASETRP
jgi:hypothetical protein